jgi:hypothetical protein
MPLSHDIDTSNHFGTVPVKHYKLDTTIFVHILQNSGPGFTHVAHQKSAFLELLQLVMSCRLEAKMGQCRHVASNHVDTWPVTVNCILVTIFIARVIRFFG